MSPVFATIAGPALPYWDAAAAASNGRTSVAEVQEDHQRQFIADAAPTPAIRKLNDRAAKLQSELDQVEAAQAEAVAVVESWNGLLRQRDILVAELGRARQQQSAIAGEISGRAEYLRGVFGSTEFDRVPVLNLGAHLLGAERLGAMLKEWIPTRESALAELERQIASFQKTHNIQTS